MGTTDGQHTWPPTLTIQNPLLRAAHSTQSALIYNHLNPINEPPRYPWPTQTHTLDP